MNAEQIAESIRQLLAQQERDDLEHLGRAQQLREMLENAKESAVRPPLENTDDQRPS